MFALLLAPASVNAQPTGYQEYYVLGYEEHIWRAFLRIYTGPEPIPAQICSTVSLVATADHQVVYYDHWEDGYELDLLHPVQGSTEIYGDGNLGNGGVGRDILLAGDDVNLTSNQDLVGPGAINGYVPVAPARDSAYIRYDGGDRIISSGGPVDLAHAMWPLGTSWVGGAWEVYSEQAYSESYSYRLPIGENLYNFGGGDYGAYGDLRDVYLQVGAFEDSTIVVIDNGAGAINLTLDRGQTYFSLDGYINSDDSAPAITVNAGTTIRSNKPIQVGLVTGADSPGGAEGGFQSRFFMALSDRMWGSDYVVPVPSGNPEGLDDNRAEIYLSNPNDFSIRVNAYDAEVQTSFIISPSNYISSTIPYSQKREGHGYVPPDSAARFTSSDGVFGVLVAADTSDVDYDWGFGGIPAHYLTRDYYVSWAPGNDCIPPNDPGCLDVGGNPAVNGSPVWVTPLSDGTTFYVDFSPLDGSVDQTFTLDVLQQRRIFDPDKDNTGTHVWATSEFAMSWGEDPRTAKREQPYLDLGLATLPLLQRWLDPVLTLDKTASPTILPLTGGTVTFTLVAHGYNSPLTNVDITDTLPLNWAYIPNSSHVAYHDGSSGNPEPARDGQILFWDLSANLDVNQSLTLTFQAQITNTGGVDRTAFDGLESNTYHGGINWASAWQEIGDNGLPGSGDIAISNVAPAVGNYSLRLRGSANAITRTVDLDGFVSPLLRFMRRLEQLEDGDYFYLDVRAGVDWTTVLTWTNGDMEGSYIQEIVDLTPFASADTSIRFRSGSAVGSDYFYLDQVQIYDGIAASVNRGEAIGKDEYSNTLFSPSDQATVSITPFELVKAVNHTQAEIGDTLVYTITYLNPSSFTTATNVMLRDAVPIQYASIQSISAGGVAYSASGAIVWSLGDLSPGSSGVVTFSAKINDFVENGVVIENIAHISSDQAQAGSNWARTTVLAPDIHLLKSGPIVAARGQVITYTVSWQNLGGSEATEVLLSDDVPQFTSYVPGSLEMDDGSGWMTLSDASDGDPGAFISPTLSITPGDLTPGTVNRIRFSVQIEPDLPPDSVLLNSATLDRKLDIPRDSNTVVTRISDLLLSKTAEQAAVVPGGIISYTLTYVNASETVTQTNIYVREPIPGYTSLITGTLYGGDQIEYSWDHGNTWHATPSITPVTHLRWRDASLAPGAQATLGLAVRVNTTLPANTTISNIAHITSSETVAREWFPSNQVDVETIILWAKKYASPSTAPAGSEVSFTISYGNHGSADALVQIVDALPSGVAYSEGSIWGAGADDSGAPTLAWEGVTLKAGSGAQVGYAVVLDSDLVSGAVITNTAILSGVYGVKTSDTATVTVIAGPDIRVVPLALAATLDTGGTLTRALTISNVGGADLNWSLGISPPVSWLGAAPSSNTLPPQGSDEVTLTFDAAGLTAGAYTTTLVVRSNDPGEPELNVLVALTVLPTPDITVNPTMLAVTLPQSTTLTRTLTISNVGEADLHWSLAVSPTAPWLGAAPTSNTLPPQGRDELTLSLDSTGLTEGAYMTALLVSSDDPDEPEVSVPIILIVLPPYPDITVSPASPAVTLTWNTTATLALNIGNAGGADLIWGIVEDPPVSWLEETPTDDIVPPLDNDEVTLTFNTADLLAGVHTTTLVVSSNDPDEPELNVPVTLTVLPWPDITISPPSLAVTLTLNTTDTRALHIRNVGEADLNWNLAVSPTLSWLDAAPISNTLPSQSSDEVTLTFDAMGLETGVYATTLIVSSNDPQEPELSIPVTLTVLPRPVLAVSPVALTETLYKGGMSTRALTVSNVGQVALTWSLTETQPPAFWLEETPVSSTLALSGSKQVTLTFDTTGLAEGTYTTTLLIYSDDIHGPAPVNIPITLNVSPPRVYNVYLPIITRLPSLSITKWAHADQVHAGTSLAYSLLVKNSGKTLTGLVVSDTLPAGVIYANCDCTTTAGAACDASFACGIDATSEIVTWSIDSLDAGSSLIMLLSVTAKRQLVDCETIVNADYAAAADSHPPVMGPPVTTTVQEFVSISKTASSPQVMLGQELTYTIKVINDSDQPLGNAVISDTLPVSVTYVSCSYGIGYGCDYSDNGNFARWAITSLPPAGVWEVTLVVRVDDDSREERVINQDYWVQLIGSRIIYGEEAVVVDILRPLSYSSLAQPRDMPRY